MPRQGTKFDAGSLCCGCRGLVIDSRLEQNSHIEAGFNPWHDKEIAPIGLCSLLQHFGAFGIKHAHAAKMSRKVPLGDEVSQSHLTPLVWAMRRDAIGT